jgi:hypothetical protein
VEGKLLQDPHDLLLAESPSFIDEVYLNRQSAIANVMRAREEGRKKCYPFM